MILSLLGVCYFPIAYFSVLNICFIVLRYEVIVHILKDFINSNALIHSDNQAGFDFDIYFPAHNFSPYDAPTMTGYSVFVKPVFDNVSNLNSWGLTIEYIAIE